MSVNLVDSENERKKFSFRSFFFSPETQRMSSGKKIAFIAVFAAFSVVVNMLEFRFLDTQFSCTLAFSVLTGIFIGGGSGFIACMIGDLVGYLIQSFGYFYMPWVGISTGMIALLSGLLYHGLPFRFRGGVYVKLALICLAAFLVCTVGINSTGFYLYNKHAFSNAVIEYAESRFGGNVTFFVYVCYRLFFKGQIWNSLANYALVFILVSVLRPVNFFRPFLGEREKGEPSSNPVSPKTE